MAKKKGRVKLSDVETLPIATPAVPRERRAYFREYHFSVGCSGASDHDVTRLKSSYRNCTGKIRNDFKTVIPEPALKWCRIAKIKNVPCIAHTEIENRDDAKKNLVKIRKNGTKEEVWCSFYTDSLYIVNVGNKEFTFRFCNDKAEYDSYSGKDAHSLRYKEDYASLGGGGKLSNETLDDMFADILRATPAQPPKKRSLKTLVSVVSEATRYRSVEDLISDECFQKVLYLTYPEYPDWYEPAVNNWAHMSFQIQEPGTLPDSVIRLVVDQPVVGDINSKTKDLNKHRKYAYLDHVGRTCADVASDMGVLKRRRDTTPNNRNYDILQPLNPKEFEVALIQLHHDCDGNMALVRSRLKEATVNLKRHAVKLSEFLKSHDAASSS